MEKYKPYKGCNCFQCTARAKRNKKYKDMSHRNFRRLSKIRIHEGNYDNFQIATGCRA